MRNLAMALMGLAALCVVGALYVGVTSGNVVVLTAQTEIGIMSLLGAIAIGTWFKT